MALQKTTRRAVTLCAGMVAVALVLVGCAPAQPPQPTATESQGPPPIFRPDLGAAANFDYFNYVNKNVIAANQKATGKDFIAALVAAGFNGSRTEVTPDQTTVGLDADSIQFSVILGGECLIGQYGTGSNGYQSAVRSFLGTGRCLVGQAAP